MIHEITPIAHIHTEFSSKFGIPRQSGLVEELKGRLFSYLAHLAFLRVRMPGVVSDGPAAPPGREHEDGSLCDPLSISP